MVNYYSAVTPQVSVQSRSTAFFLLFTFRDENELFLRSGAKRHRVHPVLQPQGAEDGLGSEPGETVSAAEVSTLEVFPHLK